MGTTVRQAERTTRFRAVPRGASVHDIADRCREGVLDFLAGAASGWSEVDLELWLGAPYRAATATFGGPQHSSRTTFSGAHKHPSNVLVEASLLEASDRVREMLASCAEGAQPEFVTYAIAYGFVTGVTDELGAIGYVPVDVGEMDLVERILSLVAADYLTRPNDFRSLTICEDCDGISFDGTSCRHDDVHAPCESGVVLRDGAPSSYAAIYPPRAR